MTWSILAYEPETETFGLAMASRFFALGAVCPYAAGGVGALSTQALVNPTYGPRGLDLLRQGLAAEEVVRRLVAADEGRETRQLHVVDAMGANAAHTGAECVDWAGHRLADGVSVAGNMLVGPQVIEATLETFLARRELPLVDRLLAAMDAGEAEGGDNRGRQSAALRIHGPEEYARLDMRADDHPEPLVELRRLWGVAQQRYIHFARAFPTAERPYGIYDRAEIDRMIEEGQKAAAQERREAGP